MRRLTAIVLSLLPLAIIACGDGDRKPPVETAPPVVRDSAPGIDIYDGPMKRDTGYNPANARNFPKVVRMEFAHMATSMPKRMTDSLLKLHDPKAIESGMTEYLHHRDSIVRSALSAKYGITLDSLDRIIRGK